MRVRARVGCLATGVPSPYGPPSLEPGRFRSALAARTDEARSRTSAANRMGRLVSVSGTLKRPMPSRASRRSPASSRSSSADPGRRYGLLRTVPPERQPQHGDPPLHHRSARRRLNLDDGRFGADRPAVPSTVTTRRTTVSSRSARPVSTSSTMLRAPTSAVWPRSSSRRAGPANPSARKQFVAVWSVIELQSVRGLGLPDRARMLV